MTEYESYRVKTFVFPGNSIDVASVVRFGAREGVAEFVPWMFEGESNRSFDELAPCHVMPCTRGIGAGDRGETNVVTC